MADPLVDQLSCSFCGKNQQQVRKLIAGPTVYICDQCIKLCNEIIARETKPVGRSPERTPAPPKKETMTSTANQLLCCSFCGKSQREARKLIAGPTVYICDECIGLCNDIIVEQIDLENVAAALSSALPADARAFLATILERGSGAAERLSEVVFQRRTREWILELASPRTLTSECRTLWKIVGERAPRPRAASPGTEVELPAWVRPVAERLTATVEVLETLSPCSNAVQPAALVDSLEWAVAQLRHARDLLIAGPPKPPAAS
jgi:hypothetical protein